MNKAVPAFLELSLVTVHDTGEEDLTPTRYAKTKLVIAAIAAFGAAATGIGEILDAILN